MLFGFYSVRYYKQIKTWIITSICFSYEYAENFLKLQTCIVRIRRCNSSNFRVIFSISGATSLLYLSLFVTSSCPRVRISSSCVRTLRNSSWTCYKRKNKIESFAEIFLQTEILVKSTKRSASDKRISNFSKRIIIS